MENKNSYYVTTAIPYVNGPAHLGFAMELIQADVLARFRRLRQRDVFFLTGADENSLKNVRASEKAGVPVRQLVDKYTEVFRKLGKSLNISADNFIRTTSPEHFAGVQALWKACEPSDLYKRTYRGLYCVGCESFYSESELINGRCPEHDEPLEVVEEENYFFRLSKYQRQLEEIIASDKLKIVPDFRKNEVLNFIRAGLKDFSVSRSQLRAKGWGVPVPDDPDQIMYVWFDALGNYLTGLGYPYDGKDGLYAKFWPANCHVIGKGIIRFHAVYWPAMLLSAKVPLPNTLFVHGYINFGGAKLSKSVGGGVDPFGLVEKYGEEAVRHHLIRHCHPFHDIEFSLEHFEASYQAELANGLGNVFQRVTTLISQQVQPIEFKGQQNQRERQFQESILRKVSPFIDLIESFKLNEAFECVWAAIREIDGYLEATSPWKLAKEKESSEEVRCILWHAAQALRIIAAYLQPLLPKASEDIARRLGDPCAVIDRNWDNERTWGYLPRIQGVIKGAPLFPRLPLK